jgi:hypothetical protein
MEWPRVFSTRQSRISVLSGFSQSAFIYRYKDVENRVKGIDAPENRLCDLLD